MGVPVSGKNMFPSNIAGLPTWYTVRANKDGYMARKKEVDFLVAMNAETAKEDVLSLEPGAAVALRRAAEAERAADRPDLLSGAVRQDRRDRLHRRQAPAARQEHDLRRRPLELLGIEMAEMEKALRKQFGKKVKAAELNMGALQAGFDYAAEHLTKQDPFRDRADGQDRAA